MARRPIIIKNDALSAKQLQDFTRSLGSLTLADVERKFRDAADRCRFNELPSPKTVQELAAAWKVLWKWNRRRSSALIRRYPYRRRCSTEIC